MRKDNLTVKYMLMLFNEITPETTDPADMPKWEAFDKEAEQRAKITSGEALHSPESATTVSVRDGKVITTDGPFVDTKEQIGGFYVLDCENLDVAIELAAKVPWAPSGHIEVRPVVDFG